MKKRRKAYDEIRKQYPETIGLLTSAKQQHFICCKVDWCLVLIRERKHDGIQFGQRM